MRVYRYAAADGARIAIAAGGPAADLGPGSPFGGSTSSLIEAGPSAWEWAAAAARSGEPVGDDVRFLCPLDRAASLRDFLAFESHVVLGAARRKSPVPDYWYEAPVYYKGNHRSLLGPGDTCPWPEYTERLDFELELACVVGRRGRDVSGPDAAGHIFGFTVMNDFSARDIQAREMSAWLGPAKGKDFATALGPCIVTADELGAEPDVEMTCRVNGGTWGRARSSEMRWRWAEMVAHVARAEEIFPCDVYGSGTPGGCCGVDLGRTLAPGDVVELEIEGIGVLVNRIEGPAG